MKSKDEFKQAYIDGDWDILEQFYDSILHDKKDAIENAFHQSRLIIENPKFDENNQFKDSEPYEIRKYEEIEDYLKDLQKLT